MKGGIIVIKLFKKRRRRIDRQDMEKGTCSCSSAFHVTSDVEYQPIFTETPMAFLTKMIQPYTLQLHVTERCNLRCRHCYGESWTNMLSFEEFKEIIAQYQEVLQLARARGVVLITGGEPLTWPHVYQAIQHVKKQGLIPKLLTNGTLITEKTCKMLKKSGLYFVQVSLDGLQDTHDAIRGVGMFDRAIRAIKLLKQAKFQVTVMFTAMKKNIDDLPGLVVLLNELGVDRLAMGRFIPTGLGEEFREQALSPTDTERLFALLTKLESRMKFELSCKDPLWAIKKDKGMMFSGCSVGNFILDVMTDGTVLPCRRLPIPVGNIQHQRLVDIWLFSPLMKKLRDRGNIKECAACPYINTCGGGCRGVAWGLQDDVLARDPQCFLKFHDKTPPERPVSFGIFDEGGTFIPIN